MIENELKAKLSGGETVFGTFIKYPEPTLAEFVAFQGWDFLIFAAVHGGLQSRDVEGLCRAAELRGVTPITRVTTNQPHIILRYLDAGSHGVHVPWVNSAEGAEEAVQAVKYWPRGQRGLAGTRASEWGMTESVSDYTRRANAETMVIAHIETIAAVEVIKDYIGIDGIDVLFIGPADLSHSMGHPGHTQHPDLVKAMERFAEAVVPSDKVLSIFAGSEDQVAAWGKRGARYFATNADAFMARGMKAYLDAVRT